MSEGSKAVSALVATMLIWGVSPVFIRSLSVGLGPADAMVIRYMAVAVVFAGVLAIKGGWRIAVQDVPRLVAVSIAGMFGYSVGSVYGFELIPASVGGLFIGTQPLLILLLAALIGREPLSLGAMIGVIVAFCGTVLLFWNNLSFSGSEADLLRGGIFIFLSGVAWAYYVVAAKPLILKYGSLQVSSLSIIIATLPMVAFASSQTVETLRTMTASQWGAMGFMVLVSTFIASIMWNYGAGRLSSGATGTFLYLIPVIAVAAGAIFLHETISANVLMGGALILAGVATAQFSGRWRMARLQKM